MADGRLFTDYRPRCDIQLERQAAMAGNQDHRQYMIGNGQKIVASMRESAQAAAGCGLCKEPYDVGTMLPEADVFRCDKLSCQRVVQDPRGFATGRAYGATHGAEAWQAAALASRAKAATQAGAAKNCCACDAQGKYDPSAKVDARQRSDVRYAVPSGGDPRATGGAVMGCAPSS